MQKARRNQRGNKQEHFCYTQALTRTVSDRNPNLQLTGGRKGVVFNVFNAFNATAVPWERGGWPINKSQHRWHIRSYTSAKTLPAHFEIDFKSCECLFHWSICWCVFCCRRQNMLIFVKHQIHLVTPFKHTSATYFSETFKLTTKTKTNRCLQNSDIVWI